jgi:hypothetical protein
MDTPAQSASASGHISFAACSSGRGELLRIGLTEDTDRRPAKAIIDVCPVCGQAHIVSLLWRRAEDREVGREPDLVVGVDGRQS